LDPVVEGERRKYKRGKDPERKSIDLLLPISHPPSFYSFHQKRRENKKRKREITVPVFKRRCF